MFNSLANDEVKINLLKDPKDYSRILYHSQQTAVIGSVLNYGAKF